MGRRLCLKGGRLIAALHVRASSLCPSFCRAECIGDAGNGQTDACNISPANVDVVLAVGATEATNKFNASSQQHDVMYTYSNTGPCVDLFAPGECAPDGA